MNLSISATFRSDHTKFVPTLPPSRRNPGGGVATKLLFLKAALPNIKVVTEIAQAESINITESLWFSEKVEGDSFESRLKRYEASNAFKILWTSDMEFARWNGHEREAIFNASDVIAGNSNYMVNILKAFVPAARLLTDPVDTSSIEPVTPKKRQIFGMSNVGIEKNIDAIIDIFGLIPEELELERFFVGSASVWGLDTRKSVSSILENRLSEVCDWRITNATRQEVRDVVGPALAYVADSKYDTFCYAMIEAMLAGCWLFCGKHLIYNERPCIRFTDPVDAVVKISEKLGEVGLQVNEEARQYVIDNYSLSVFRRQLADIIGGNYGL